MIAPLVAFSSPAISRPMVVLPHPDSPTMPNVRPGRIEKLTSATALTSPILRCSTAPEVTEKFFTRPSVDSSTWPSAGGAARSRRSCATSVTGSRAASASFAAWPTGKKQRNR